MKQLITALLFLMIFTSLEAQEKAYKVAAIGFYNFENLFDTEDDPLINDEEFTPDGGKGWTDELYNEKLDNMATVVSKLGTELSPDGLAILGVCEIENKKVLEDFVKEEKIKDRDYQIVHYDSNDGRGIDVGLLYQAKYFEVKNSKSLPLNLTKKDGSEKHTRDVLLVSGMFDGEMIHVMVNHWPSRSGGARATAKFRNIGADVCKAAADSILVENPNAKIFIMGDMNDDPTSPSVRKHIPARADKKTTPKKGFYNPMVSLYKKGIGSLAYRDAWNVFDQIIMTKGAVDPKVGGYQYYKVRIFNEPFMVNKSGQYKGYPKRTFAGGKYQGGYSDHFPVFVYLIKEDK